MKLTKDYTKLRDLVLKMEPDIKKMEEGVKAGGKRARKTLQEVKKLSQALRLDIQTEIKSI